RARAHNEDHTWLLEWYESSPLVARLADSGYRFVANHRGLFSFLTRIGWGNHVERPSSLLVRSLFVRSLGLIYLIALISLWVQISGLSGAGGILPAKDTIEMLQQQADAQKLGWERYRIAPTLCWLSASDVSLNWQCGTGAVLAILVML